MGFNIDHLPEDIKLRILELEPCLRFASRSWYILNNTLYKIKFYQLMNISWDISKVNQYIPFLAELENYRKPLRELCYNYELSRGNNPKKFLSDSWFLVYNGVYMFPILFLQNICANYLNTNVYCSLQATLLPNEKYSCNVWFKVKWNNANYPINVSVVISGENEDFDIPRIFPKSVNTHQWIREDGIHCVRFDNFQTPTNDVNEALTFQFNVFVSCSHNGILPVEPLLIDLTPYQRNKEWFSFRVPKENSFQKVCAKESGFYNPELKELNEEIIIQKESMKLLGLSEMNNSSSIQEDEREFVFKYPKEKAINENLSWTGPYILG